MAEQPKTGGDPSTSKRTTLGICALLLSIFTAIALCAVSGKGATMDEPLHLVAAWMQTHFNDFRCNMEDPPLWRIWAAAGLDGRLLHPNIDSPAWRAIPLQMGAQQPFVKQTLFATPGVNADAVVARILASVPAPT